MQIGFCGLLFIVFLILKLTGVIAWSWLWITSPLWLGFALFIVFLMFVALFVGRLR